MNHSVKNYWYILAVASAFFLLAGVLWMLSRRGQDRVPSAEERTVHQDEEFTTVAHPVMIAALRARAYPGSDIVIEETLSAGSNYDRYVASYLSDGLKIYGLLTIPRGALPPGGYPAVVFNHGYIPPDEYRTTERYAAYVDGFARAGYVVFKIDYRGHGDSEGKANGAHYDPGYVIDAINALSSLKRHAQVNQDQIGMWGHSMGGHVTLAAMVVSPDIKAGVIWAGVVGTYDEFFDQWRNRRKSQAEPEPAENIRRHGADLIAEYGEPRQTSDFWRAVAPTNFLSEISGSVEIHHAEDDATVPVAFSEVLYRRLTAAGVTAELYLYPGGDHNISSPHFSLAMQRSIAFFGTHMKQAVPAKSSLEAAADSEGIKLSPSEPPLSTLTPLTNAVSPSAVSILPTTPPVPVLPPPTSSPQSLPTPFPVISSPYPWHQNITATVFWVGEPVGNGSSEDNALSCWDDDWQEHYGGYDDPFCREGYYPCNFIPMEQNFYVSVPYTDFDDNGERKSSADTVVPWTGEQDWAGKSMMKGRWVELQHEGHTCYAQVNDCGPYEYDDWEYVFGANGKESSPQNNLANNDGMDVSPAVRDCLHFEGLNNADNKINWRFVDASAVPSGPWRERETDNETRWK